VYRRLPDALSESIADLLSTQRVPGAVAGIVSSSGATAVDCFGAMSLDSDEPPTPTTRFAIGSITSTLTAAAVLLLRDSDLLDLDDPLLRYIPEFAAIEPREGDPADVTLRHLLTHRAGLPASLPVDRTDDGATAGVDAVVAALPTTAIVKPPDARSIPSSLGYALVGEVIRRLTGHAPETFLRDELLTPLGMTSTVFDIAPEHHTQLATGYEVRPFEDQLLPAPTIDIGAARPADGAYSTFEDLATWLSFLLTPDIDGGPIGLSSASRDELLRPHGTAADGSGVGMPWFTSTPDGVRSIGLVGGFIGYLSHVELFPDAGLGAVILTNLHGHAATAEVVDRIRNQPATPLTVEEPGPGYRTLERPVATPPDYRDYLGLYLRSEGIPGREGRFGRVEYRHGRLTLVRLDVRGTGGFPSPLAPAAEPDIFRPLEGYGIGEDLRFARDRNGAVAGFTLEAGADWAKLAGAAPG
jgi:CubicO group peptidase (beta-lactamase class C family)